jgi:hypothetical protein
VPEGAAKAVKLPDDQGVTGPQLVQDLLEDRAVAAGAAGGLGEYPIAAGALEGVDLELGLLVGGGDAGLSSRLGRGSGGCRRNGRGLKWVVASLPH